MRKRIIDFIKFFSMSILLLILLLGLVCLMMWDIHYFLIPIIWRAIVIMATLISILTILIAPKAQNQNP